MDYKRIKGFDEISSGAEVLIYGTGSSAKQLYGDIDTKRPDITVRAFVDSYKSSGSVFSIPIVNIADIEDINRCKIIIASMFYEEIVEGLVARGCHNFCTYRKPGYFLDQYTEFSLIDRERLVLLDSPPELESRKTYYIFNVGTAEGAGDAALAVMNYRKDSRVSYAFSSVVDYKYEDALSGYDSDKFDSICVIDVGGQIFHLAGLVKFITRDLGKTVQVYKRPSVDRNFSVVEGRELLFIEICKNGLSSTSFAMGTLFKKYEEHKFKYDQQRNYGDVTAPYFAGYKKFAIVRNPYERLASVFAHNMRVGPDEFLKPALRNVVSPFTFENFCRFVANCPDEFSDVHFLSQTAHLTFPDGLMKDMTLLRMENYADEIKKFFAEMGEEVDIVHKNKSRPNKVDYLKDYYTPELIKLVNERFESDFINFGYEFL